MRGTMTVTLFRREKHHCWTMIIRRTGEKPKWESTETTNWHEANEIKNEYIRKHKKRTVESGSPLADWLDKWLQFKKHSLAFRSHESYGSIIRNHLKPGLGGVRLSDLDPQHLAEYCAMKREEGKLDETTLCDHISILSSALTDAVEMKKLSENPVSNFKLGRPKRERREAKFWKRDQVARFFQEASKQPTMIHALLLTLWQTGARIGEVLGLLWEDIDLESDRCKIFIRRSLKKAGSKPILGKPKQNQKRTISVASDLKELLIRHRREQLEFKLRAGDRYNDKGLVFSKKAPRARPSSWGNPLEVGNFNERYFHPIREAAGLPDLSCHGIRHSALTYLALNAPMKMVSSRAGHHDIQMTFDTYAHFVEEADERCADLMEIDLPKAAGSSRKLD